jgi:hypothetical protein
MTLQPGRRLPFCVGASRDQRFYTPDVQAGRPAVLVLSGSLRSPYLRPVTDALASLAPAIAATNADLLVLGGFSAGPVAWGPDLGFAPGLQLVLCNDGFFPECGLAPDDTAVVVIDRAWRALGAWSARGADAVQVAEAALRTLTAIRREACRACCAPAPILAVPHLFSAEFCAALIDHFETGTQFDSGVTGAAPDGSSVDRLDYRRKRRSDCLLLPEDATYKRAMDAIYGGCGPAIKQAFHCDVAFNDRVLIARYDATGGYFKRHRDNTNEAVAFRKFALSVNLNTGAYAGGELVFPEFNDHLYAPGAGDGVVFSTSLLHEALPVTSGQRYVLLTFLHDAEAEQRRLAQKDQQRARILDEAQKAVGAPTLNSAPEESDSIVA